MSAQQISFEKHLEEPGFLVGAKQGAWGILRDAPESPKWPNALFWVAAPEREGCLERYYLMLTLTGYPETAPSATFWDLKNNERLKDADWPKGDADFVLAFNPGRPNGFYLPCDGIGRAGKEGIWKVAAPEYWWTEDSKIDLYLSQVWGYFNSARYVGI